MKFREFQQVVRTDGMGAALLRALHRLTFLNFDQVGAWSERFGNNASVDGLTISLDNQLISTHCKGTIVADWYEQQARQIFHKHFPRNEPLIELGGSIGVVSCIVNRSLVSPEQHIVVEANPALIPTLKKNRDLNGCQFKIIEAAIAYDSPAITFFSHNGSLGGSVYPGKGQTMQVATRTLQSIAENAGFQHFNLIADIEGSEVDLVEHELDFLHEHTGLLLVEIHYDTPHGDQGVEAVLETLQSNGFELIDKIFTNYCFRNEASLKQA